MPARVEAIVRHTSVKRNLFYRFSIPDRPPWTSNFRGGKGGPIIKALDADFGGKNVHRSIRLRLSRHLMVSGAGRGPLAVN